MDSNAVVYPGDEVAIAEEYIPGNGTYEFNGKLFASVIGRIKIDGKERIISVIPFHNMESIPLNSIVYGAVDDVKQSTAGITVYFIEGRKEMLTGKYEGVIHISKVIHGYAKDFSLYIRIGDIIRASVIRLNPLELSIIDNGMGVLIGYCTKCRNIMERRDKVLYCKVCERSEFRKISDNYRDPVIF
ncbi:MAG: exosome complex RNA-binding protein Csl4 [Candidatus Thermoplasmatota archaeon]|jgi:exosome complex component CSL4|nr:exosome complex RNA-binding protein Csl4 [Candidatus Thermoplasmatota archaeon]